MTTNARRTREDFEYELIDTGVFDDDRYFDVFVEYAKSSPEECFIRITVANRGPEAATLRPVADAVVPQHLELVARRDQAAPGGRDTAPTARASIAASHPDLGDRWLYCDGAPPLLFTENDTNTRAALRHAERRAPTSRTPSTRSSWTGTPPRSTRRRSAPRPPRTTASKSAPASRWPSVSV